MEKTNADSEMRVDLFLRPGGRTLWSHHQDVLDRVERLAAEDVVDYHRIQFWPREVAIGGPMSDTTYHQSIVETTDEFLEWAEEIGHPVFDLQSEVVESRLTGDRQYVRRLPACCLAVYDDDELVDVYPHREDDAIVTVEDAIDRLEAGESVDSSGTWTPSAATSNSN